MALPKSRNPQNAKKGQYRPVKQCNRFKIKLDALSACDQHRMNLKNRHRKKYPQKVEYQTA
jgi:hypothetical protein